MASNVPKFSSFKPKSKESPSTSNKPHSHRPKREREPSPSASRPTSPPKLRPSKHPDASPSVSSHAKRDSCFVDRKGDPDNLRYGRLNRYDIPRYHRFGRGQVLGLPNSFRIDREKSADGDIVLTGPPSTHRERLLTTKRAAATLTDPVRFLRPHRTEHSPGNVDYIKLPGSRKAEREHDHAPAQLDLHSGNLTDVDSRSSDFDSDESEEPHASTDTVTTTTTRENFTLIQKTRDEPQNLQRWQDLIAHQEKMLSMGAPSRHLESQDRRNLADLRIPLYEQALKKIDDRQSQLALHLGLMSEAVNLWDNEKLQTKWTELLSKYPQSPVLWIQYLDFVQGNFTSFKYEECRSLYQRCLGSLQHGPPTGNVMEIVHIFVRFTSMVREAGYQELAIAIWQAVLEFHLMSPTSTDMADVKDRLDSLEEFWDSEVPRIGEPGAKGWGQYTGEASPTVQSAALDPECQSSPVHNFKGFGVREAELMDKMLYPGRTTDTFGEEDPFHLILFSDLKDYLQVLPANPPWSLLLDGFLCFAGMPPLPSCEENRCSWSSDPFLTPTSIDVGSGATASTGELMEWPADYQVSTRLLFTPLFPAMLKRPLASPITRRILPFVREVLRLLANCYSHGAQEIGEYLLALEASFFPSESVKTAKQLLKNNPASLRLYNAYALVESQRGNLQKAEQVCAAALSLRDNTAPTETTDGLALAETWVWEALARNDRLAALWRLIHSLDASIAIPEDKTQFPSQADLLRAETHLRESNERTLLGRNFAAAIVLTELHGLLRYLSSDQEAAEYMAIHDRLSAWFDSHALSTTPAAEIHAQNLALFLAHHSTHCRIVKPALLRDALHPLILRFPNNTLLLSAYARNEARFAIDDRVREIMHGGFVTQGKDSLVTTWLLAIRYEIVRGAVAGSTSHSVRALFRRAEEGGGKNAYAIWVSHVIFELREYESEFRRRSGRKSRRSEEKSKHETLLEENRRRVKEVYFRGLTHLPWSKEYMMLAFTVLKDLLEEEELRRVYYLMVEKELRLHVDLDEHDGT
ncbi:DUF1740-domain-containing protein [Sporormia fimetaria CBS 119925]|uniref:DUF1740-domain-containing protein n=1 Tax=Sporormia fimetaria CBS 119925 TaxID=1340428 RepID=A0A6A6VF92_9PLEO|nr:DUF1740-domain-containing protein [Sporormia fimetaria CBS 119925]